MNYGFRAKRFYLQRKTDVSGISGIGIVAEGIEFLNGLVALSWISPHPCVLMYPSIRQIEELHGHQGQTNVIWMDKPEIKSENNGSLVKVSTWEGDMNYPLYIPVGLRPLEVEDDLVGQIKVTVEFSKKIPNPTGN